jgi:hypothetical protein
MSRMKRRGGYSRFGRSVWDCTRSIVTVLAVAITLAGGPVSPGTQHGGLAGSVSSISNVEGHGPPHRADGPPLMQAYLPDESSARSDPDPGKSRPPRRP